MKQNKNEIIRNAFIGKNIKQMTELLVYLSSDKDEKLTVSLKKLSSKVTIPGAEPSYTILTPDSQLNRVFEKGLDYCIKNDFDTIICCYPNLDYDTVENIKARNYGMSK